MSAHLEKAKAALDAARALEERAGLEMTDRANKDFLRLVDIAAVQASLAQAEALTIIASVLNPEAAKE